MAGKPQTRLRVREIAQLMREMRWNTEARFRLADKWGMQESSVRKLSARASKMVQEEIETESTQETRSVAAAALRKIAGDCEVFSGSLRSRSPHSALLALRVKLEAVRTIAAMCGLNSPQQHEIRHVTEMLQREHEQMYERLERRLPNEVFQQVIQALSADSDAKAGAADLPGGGAQASGKDPAIY